MSARRPWAWPLVPIYAAAQRVENALRSMGFPRTRSLSWPVVSVGSLSAGGAGKTPLVIALTTLLEDHGWTVDVLSRGYSRAGRQIERVEVSPDADEEAMFAAENAARYGDEPLLIAQRTGAEVWVGADRFAAGTRAEQRAGWVSEQRVHLLDDGFQHRRLARAFDILAVTQEDLEDHLLPAGNLREPLSALARADAIVVREDEQEAVETTLRMLLPRPVPMWTIRRALRFPQPLGVFATGLRPLAMCALARPEGFSDSLRAAGCGIVDTVVFPDHHRYTDRSLSEAIALGKQLRATGLVTTEKDAVKLTQAMRSRIEAELGPLAVVALDAHFVYESPVARTLEERLRGRALAGAAR